MIYKLILLLEPLKPLGPLSFNFLEEKKSLARTFETSGTFRTSKFWRSLKIDLYIVLYIDNTSGTYGTSGTPRTSKF